MKKHVCLLLFVLALLLVGCAEICESKEPYESYEPYELYDAQESYEDTGGFVKNPFFFPLCVNSAAFEGEFWAMGDVYALDIGLSIDFVEETDNGYLYSLRLDSIEGLADYRLFLGYFYVQPHAIYRRFSAEQSFNMVSTNEAVGRVAVDGQWRSYVEIYGNYRIFRLYSVDSFQGATRFYERIVWEKGRGIVYYHSGYGAMREHLEFSAAGFEQSGHRSQRGYSETFTSLIQNESTFIYRTVRLEAGYRPIVLFEPMFLNDFLQQESRYDSYIFEVVDFALVDMDGNGIPELILTITPGPTRLVLRYRGGVVWADAFAIRGLRTIMTDGTFDIQGSAGSGRIARLEFDYGVWGITNSIAIYDWWRTSDTFYFNGLAVNEEEFNNAVESALEYFLNKEEVTWHPFDDFWTIFER